MIGVYDCVRCVMSMYDNVIGVCDICDEHVLACVIYVMSMYDDVIGVCDICDEHVYVMT